MANSDAGGASDSNTEIITPADPVEQAVPWCCLTTGG
jgi:hypothetical protein